MKIGIVNASSQRDKNRLIEKELLAAVKGHSMEVINFGITDQEPGNYSYIQMAIATSLLLSSGAVDFVVTGCSSGTGMMLACNGMPDVVCGYLANPTDAYLFGRINDGNAISFPFGSIDGWAGELNLRYTLEKLFAEPFGIGYPLAEADRKLADTAQLKTLKKIAQKSLITVLPQLEQSLLLPVLERPFFYEYVVKEGNDQGLKKVLLDLKS
ncbi:RpiB/LacA/LacB family sugar-phosphate isomerase [Vagococcus sp. BWB3-3]|uniref:RpiB/LacA/LacB family sugar-phosphate isomerase n=1 Tax=Vagococcus allomyrinae TaxID=2794353 RepID=A0A940PD63_9ENTE|nr:RpiB/LacA/LacB family sugar-phosphate isomerase [Vagococcus allomyrinae]MBP1042640.1 RpiB/LacA/LacB family sugar-phosphate isomerase [Vagococcus allomyrinae]